jgi:hypothetical protein
MAEPAVPKTPLSVPELATRAATYGALFAVASALLVMMLWFNDSQTKRVDHVAAEVADLRKDLNVLRVEFVEFRAETRAEFKALHVELAGMRTDLAEIKTLLETRPR